MSAASSIKGMTYINSGHTFNNKPYASYRRPTASTTRSASSTRSTRPTLRSRSTSNAKPHESTFLYPRSPPLSPKPSVIYRQVTVTASADHEKRRHATDKRPAEISSTWLMTPPRSSRNSLKDNIKRLSFNSTHSTDSKTVKGSKSRRPSSINKASISRPIVEESPRKSTAIAPKSTPQPLTLDLRGPVSPPKWNSFRTFANATPPLPQRSSARTFMNLSGPPSPPLTRPPTNQSSRTNLYHASASSATVGSRPPTSYHHPITPPTTSSSARDSGTASLNGGDTGASTPHLTDLPSHAAPLAHPDELKSFIQWSDTDSEIGSLDAGTRRRTAFKRLVRERGSLKNLRHGFDSAVEGVKRSVHSVPTSAGQSGMASVVGSGRQSTVRPSTPSLRQKSSLTQLGHTQSQAQAQTLRNKVISPPMSGLVTRPTSPVPMVPVEEERYAPTASRPRTPNPNVWISSEGVPQGVAVKRRSTHLASEDVDLNYLEQVRALSRVDATTSSAGCQRPAKRDVQHHARQLDSTRQERMHQAQKEEKKRAEEREKKLRAEEKRLRDKRGRNREGKVWESEKSMRGGTKEKEGRSWFARMCFG